MSSIHHLAIRALPLVGALLLPNLGQSAEPSATLADRLPANRPTPQVISVRLAAILAASLPKFVPGPAAAGSEATARRTEASPDNENLQLPTYVVHGPRPPAFSERDIHTQRGLAGIAQKRYITQLDRALNRYRIPLFSISTEARALAMYAEDERLQNMADLDRTARNAALIDRVAGAEIKRLADATYRRIPQ